MKQPIRKSLKFGLSFVLSLLTLFTSARLSAQQPAEVLQKFVTDDVVAFATIDLAKLEPAAVLKQLEDLGLADGREKPKMEASVKFAERNIQELKESGIQRIYVLLRISDMADGGPSIVVPVADEVDVHLALQQWKKSTQFLPPLKVEASDQFIFAAASDPQMKRLKSAPDTAAGSSRDLSAAIAAIGDGSIGLVVCGDTDSRRVARSLMPTLPVPFDSITGKLLADDLEWALVQVNLPPTTSLNIALQSTSEEAADRVVQAIKPAMQQLSELPAVESIFPDGPRQAVFKALQPTQKGTRVLLSLDDVTGDIEKLAQAMKQPLMKIRESALMAQEKNSLKQFALAMHNYESAYKKFPRVDGKSDRHSAGLSWRVHVLPYLEQNELYQQFHLDEPWDSEHNLKLVNSMPEIFRSPLTQYAEVNDEGRTSYQVPVGPEAIFHSDAESETFGTITDGTVNTLMLVSTSPESAVIWTKPSDWEYDLENPLKGLKAEGRESIVIARADGSVESIPITIDPKVLKALITFAGSESISSN